MIVEELIARLSLRADGVDKVKAATKTLTDLKRVLNSLSSGMRVNLSGPANLARNLKSYTDAARVAREAQKRLASGSDFGRADAGAQRHIVTVQRLGAVYRDAARQARALGSIQPPTMRGSRSWIGNELKHLRDYQRVQRQVAAESKRSGAPHVRPGIRYGAEPPAHAGVGGVVTGVGGVALAKKVAGKAMASWSEMDEATRRQRALLGIDEATQAPLQKQALRIGQETRFSNPDVVRGQTRIGSSMPAHLKDPGIIASITSAAKDYALAMKTTLDEGTEAILGRMLGMKYDMSSPDAATASAVKAANALVQWAKSSGAEHHDVMGYTKYGAAAGHTAGFSEEFSDAMAAGLRRIGYEGSMGGNFVRSAATRLSVPTNQGLSALAASNIDHNDYVAKGGQKFEVGGLEKSMKRRFGKSMSAEQSKRLEALFNNEDVVGKREDFVEQVSAELQSAFARTTKKGAPNAQDSAAIAKVVDNFYSATAGAVDVERLMKDIIQKGLTPRLSKYLFGSEHGARAQALDAATLEKDQESFRNTPKDRAERVGKDINAGYYGAEQKAIGAVETTWMRIGQANDVAMTAIAGKVEAVAESFSGLSDKTIQLGTAAAAAAVALGAIKGVAAAGAALGVPGAAATGAAAGAVVRAVPMVALAYAGVLAADAVGEGAKAIGGVAAGQYWQPKDQAALEDLEQQKAKAEAEVAQIRARTHPAMQGNTNPDLDRLSSSIADLNNRIAAFTQDREDRIGRERLDSGAAARRAGQAVSYVGIDAASSATPTEPASPSGIPAPFIPVPPARPVPLPPVRPTGLPAAPGAARAQAQAPAAAPTELASVEAESAALVAAAAAYETMKTARAEAAGASPIPTAPVAPTAPDARPAALEAPPAPVARATLPPAVAPASPVQTAPVRNEADTGTRPVVAAPRQAAPAAVPAAVPVSAPAPVSAAPDPRIELKRREASALRDEYAQLQQQMNGLSIPGSDTAATSLAPLADRAREVSAAIKEVAAEIAALSSGATAANAAVSQIGSTFTGPAALAAGAAAMLAAVDRIQAGATAAGQSMTQSLQIQGRVDMDNAALAATLGLVRQINAEIAGARSAAASMAAGARTTASGLVKASNGFTAGATTP